MPVFCVASVLLTEGLRDEIGNNEQIDHILALKTSAFSN